jgi:molybdopterin converting factor small subunit
MTLATTITVRVPTPLRECCGGASRVVVSADSMRAVLAQLESSYPALHRSVCDETGKVRPHIGLFVNSFHVRDRNGLDTMLAPGDVVHIFPAVSGG